MCCGKGKTQFRAGASNPQSRMPVQVYSDPLLTRNSGVTFQYIGRTGLTVVGRSTGRQYRFDSPGSHVQVDPRDAPSVAAIPVMKRIGPPRSGPRR